MSDQRTDNVRPEAEAIQAMCALVEGAREGAVNLGELLTAARDNGAAQTADEFGRAGQAAVSGEDFLFLLKTDRPAAVSIDDGAPLPMSPIEGTGYLHRVERLRLGTTHNFLWNVGGHVVGGMGGTM